MFRYFFLFCFKLVLFFYLIVFIAFQEAEAKSAAAEERERSVNERLSQTLSRINVLEAQVWIFVGYLVLSTVAIS